ncbi:MAG: alpha/beta hydrolase fold domain-containing protein [Chthoniobacteraceae bacterium]
MTTYSNRHSGGIVSWASRLRHLAVTFVVLLIGARAPAEFALVDEDKLAFLGDSITAARGYTKIVEHYTLMRFPERKIRFVNAGQGGDTVAGSLDRLERDVFSKGATVVTVVFGVNDIGWGMKADAEHRQRYLDGIRQLIERCRDRRVRPIVCSPAITAEDPDKAESGFLQKMADEGLSVARSLGAQTIDLQRGMREIQRRIIEANGRESDPRKHTHLHVADGVHLTDLGQLAMAYAMLKGLGAPVDVSSATIDAAAGTTTESAGCTISAVEKRGDVLSFTRLDEGWPLTLEPLSALNFRWIPIPDGINGFRLKVRNLPPGEFEIMAGDRSLGREKAEALDRGVNLTTMTADPWVPGGPWNVQSDIVKDLVEARDRVWAADRQRERFGAAHPDPGQSAADFHRLDEQVVTLQRAAAQPYAYRVVVRPAAKSDKEKESGSITIREGIEYGNADDTKLLLDVYLPKSGTGKKPRPAVILVHGGGWEGGSRRADYMMELGRELARAGFVAFNIDYRLVKRPRDSEPVRNAYPAAVDDCQRAVRWVRQHADEYGIDPDRLGALGDSAGGHLVSLLGTRETRADSPPELAAYPSRVDAVVDIFGPADFTQPLPEIDLAGITPRQMVRNFVVDDSAQIRDASPIFHVDEKTPPFLIFHGTEDKIVPIEQSRSFQAALKKAGTEVELVEFPGEGHGFSPPIQTKMTQRAIEFFKRTLGE